MEEGVFEEVGWRPLDVAFVGDDIETSDSVEEFDGDDEPWWGWSVDEYLRA